MDNCYAQEPPRQYTAYQTSETIRIDGKATELSWVKSKWSDEYIDIEGAKKAKYKTQMKMIWDKQYLYIYAKLEAPHIWANLYQRDTIVYYNNAFEIFIDPDGDTYNYMEFQFNALNTIWDLFLTKPYLNDGIALDYWNVNNLLSAVYIDGTLNNPKDKDNFWSVEIALPWDAIVETTADKKIPKNQFWRMNFSRVNWDYKLETGKYKRKQGSDGKILPANYWLWTPHSVNNTHIPEDWGYVFFTDKKIGESTTFIIPKDEHIKWYMYEVYRKITDKNKAKKNDFVTSKKRILNKDVQINRKQESNSWYLWAKSPFTNKILIIDDNRRYHEKNK